MKDNNSRPPNPAKYLGAGLSWVASTGLFLYLGTLVDGRFQTKPTFTVVGAFIGGAAGFYYLYRQLVANTRRPGNKKETDHKQ